MHDVRGDVSAKTTWNLDDIDNSADGFKPGKGTLVPPTEADKALDLTKVRYRIIRVGTTPVLKVTYRVAGPFRYAHKQSSASDNSYTESYDVDGIETILGGGRFTIELLSDGKRRDNGLFHNSDQHHQIACRGVRSHMPIDGNTATQIVPLSCLTRLGIKASRLRAVSAHYVIDRHVRIAANNAHPHMQETVQASVGTDTVTTAERLCFTP